MGTITVTLTEGEVRALLHSTGRGHQRPTKRTKNLLAVERKLLRALPQPSVAAYKANWQRDGSAVARKAHETRGTK